MISFAELAIFVLCYSMKFLKLYQEVKEGGEREERERNIYWKVHEKLKKYSLENSTRPTIKKARSWVLCSTPNK